MTEKQIKELYIEQTERSLPDKDALWSRIESRIKPKSVTVTPAPTPKKMPLHSKIGYFSAITAACIVLVTAIPVLVNEIKSSDQLHADSTFAEAPMYSQTDDVEQNNSESVRPAPSDKPLDYNDLLFESYSETAYKINGEPFGDSYFVAEDILSKTDAIIVAEVTKVYPKEDGSSLIYELENVDGTDNSVTVVESRSVSPLRRGRQYLLLLSHTENGWQTAYDNVPQTEFTADGGIVYYNGWNVLDNESSESIIYPKNQADEFFYDRMMYCGDPDLDGLFSLWETLKSI